MKKVLYKSSLKKLTVKLFFTMALLTSVFANAQEEDITNDLFTQTTVDDEITTSTDFGNSLDISSNFGSSLFTAATDPGLPGNSDNVTDVPGAPVDDWALPFALLSLILGYFYFRKRTTIFNS
jgi:hypothetical protein